MTCIDFNGDWAYRRIDEDKWFKINLPHDAMFFEKRSASSKGKGNTGWFPGGDYEYGKSFVLPQEYREKHIMFEFEGVYRNAEVFINGQKASYRPYGYTNFYVEADSYLNFGGNNVIKVIARNSDQPNSRWYSGSGIYRPVHMFVMEQKHILMNGIRITTLSASPPVISVEVKTNGPGILKVELLDQEQVIASAEELTDGEKTICFDVPIGILWSPKQPYLYQCNVIFELDQEVVSFGIRKVTWDTEKGFAINGERVILKGACIHHDNGLLGACGFEEAERRKIAILKEVGYNAIRSAHNPCSKYLLKACDELGMLVMDEYIDMWYIHKTQFDYADYFKDWWKEDLRDMVQKDYNHPSVILYSTGNEVSETAQKRGIQITGEMTQYLHSLDDTRPVTCGVNIFFNFLSSIGLGVYSDKKAERENEPIGSEFYNKLAGILGDKAMKIGAAFYGCDLKTRDAFANMDIAGYNYGILRYRHDLKKYPQRLILGSETFCKDAFDFMEIATKNPRIIGDFVWAGMDYLGEAGIGAWVHEDYAPDIKNRVGWLLSGSGRVDITGKLLGEALYTKVALKETEGPLIAVRPVYQKGAHSPSAWKMTDAIDSWSWPNCEGEEAVVEVYARGAIIRLSINDGTVFEKEVKKGCRTVFRVPYQNGKITAVSLDWNGKEIGSHTLFSANEKTILRLQPEEARVKPGGLSFIRISYTDEFGILKPMERHRIHVEVTGGRLLAFGNACPYNLQGYGESHTETYYGEAMAVIRAFDHEEENVSIRAFDGERKAEFNLPICKIIQKK